MLNTVRCLLTWMLFLGVLVFLSFPYLTMSRSIQCDLTKEYPLLDDISNTTLRCVTCRTCKPGEEPKIPCGTPVGRYDQVGTCRPCENGTYSARDDTRPCQVCRSQNCFEHQVVQGICLPDQRDETYCLDKCYSGYVMNKDRTGCIPQQDTTEKPDTTTLKQTATLRTSDSTTMKQTASNLAPSNPTTSNFAPSNLTTSNLAPSNPTTSNLAPSNPTTSNLAPSNPTTSNLAPSNPTTSNLAPSNPTTSNLAPSNPTTNTTTTTNLVLLNNQKETNNVPTIVIVILAIVIVLIIIGIICKVLWPRLVMSQTTEQQGKKCEDDVELLVVEKDKIITQEESKEAGLPILMPHCPETSGGVDASRND